VASPHSPSPNKYLLIPPPSLFVPNLSFAFFRRTATREEYGSRHFPLLSESEAEGGTAVSPWSFLPLPPCVLAISGSTMMYRKRTPKLCLLALIRPSLSFGRCRGRHYPPPPPFSRSYEIREASNNFPFLQCYTLFFSSVRMVKNLLFISFPFLSQNLRLARILV